MKNILVPTDFSKCANNALKYAYEIATRTGATIHLMHVIYPSEGINNNIYNAVWEDEYYLARKKSLDQVVRRFRRNDHFKAVPVVTEAITGFPALTADDYAEQIDADLIVMGTTGATGISGALLGSITSTLISRTKRPIFAVPLKGMYRTSAHLTFATDFKLDLNKKTLDVLKEVVKIHHSTLKAVHIIPDEQPNEKHDTGKEQVIAKKLDGISVDFHYIHDTDVSQGLNDFLEATDSHCLVTVAHNHNFWHKVFVGSTSKLLSRYIHVPMLVLHDAVA